jgi:RimJ/RimL family protein N-acetyltransferase
MPGVSLHRFEADGRHYAVDPGSCFCFECDAISRDVLEHYPQLPVNRILKLLEDRHPRRELEEVIGELEWLRSAKSILQSPKLAELEKLYAVSGGLRFLSMDWHGNEASQDAEAAFQFLLGRAEGQRELTLELTFADKLPDFADLDALRERWTRAARACGKSLSVLVRLSVAGLKSPPHSLAGHRLEVVLPIAGLSQPERDLRKALESSSLAGLAKWMGSLPGEAAGRIVLLPTGAVFDDAAKSLREAGFNHIEFDLAFAFVSLAPEALERCFQSLKQNTAWYAEALLKRERFRLEPVAGLFLRVYQGTPSPRLDDSGQQALHLRREGDALRVYPSRAFADMRALPLGAADTPADPARIADFENAGSLTTAACTACWARNLCGGGTLAAHQALSGSVREPHPAWCAAQRSWIESSIAAFNRLSHAGVNFLQLYDAMAQKPRMGLWQAARTILNAPLLLRPIADSDAAMLANWENWNPAAYFLAHEAGAMTTCPYDREMDAVHPREFEQEFIVTASGGQALGLLRLRPMLLPGCATVWVYLRDPAAYRAASMQRGFRNLLALLPEQKGLRRLMVPVGPRDTGLGEFLRAAGFEPAGTARQAFFLHGAYHDLAWFSYTLR